MKLNLSEDIISSEDLRSVAEELKDYQGFLRHGQIRSHVTKHVARPGPELSEAARSLLSTAMEQQHHPLNPDELEDLIAELEKIYDASPRLKIILAAVPNASIKKQITQWVRQNIRANVLIDFRYNQALLGGMVVAVGSHIFDWSMRRQILADQPKLNEMIANV